MDRMSSGLNGPSANVPSISNETVPTPSLQQLIEEFVELMARKISSNNLFDHQKHCEFLVSSDHLFSAAKAKLTPLMESGGIDSAVEFVEEFRLHMLFGE